MKYLRGFNESNEVNDIYSEISYDRYRRDFAYGAAVDISAKALAVIDKHNIKGGLGTFQDLEAKDSNSYYSFNKSNDSNDGWIDDDNDDDDDDGLGIIELRDEYFLVITNLSYDVFSYFLCDQLDGLDKFLTDFSDEL